MDRTKALHGPQTQAYGETNYLKKKYKFWTEPRSCMVLGLKPMGKPTTKRKNTSFGQNQGLAWSSDSSLWGNQLLKEKIQVLDRTKALHGPRTQAYGETNYLKKIYKFWTKRRPCMVLGLKPMWKPTT